jgi:hypothetical protein
MRSQAMTYQGHVENGAIVLDTPVTLPDGTVVEVTILPPAESPPTTADEAKDAVARVTGCLKLDRPTDEIIAEMRDGIS